MSILPPFCGCKDGTHHRWHFQTWGGWQVVCDAVERLGYYVETSNGWRWAPVRPAELFAA